MMYQVKNIRTNSQKRTRVIRPLLVASMCFVLTACATQLVYRNLDWIILEYLDDYVTLDREQEEIFEHQLNLVIDWHQQNELPRYNSQLNDLIQLEASDVNAELILAHQQKFRGHIQRLVDRISPDLYSLTMLLTEEQSNEFFRHYSEKNQEYYDERGNTSDQEYRENYLERLQDNAEKWLGDLSLEQKQLLIEWSQAVKTTQNDWYIYRLDMQDELKTLFTRRDQPFYFQPLFNEILTQPETRYSPDLQDKLALNNQLTISYIQKLTIMMSDKQWEHFKDELLVWKSRLESLTT